METLRGFFTVQFQQEGIPGKDGVVYTLVPSCDQVKRTVDGTYLPDALSCKRFIREGSQGAYTTHEGEFYYQYGESGTRKVYPDGGIRLTGDIDSVIFVWLINGEEIKKTVSVLSDGANSFVVDADDEMIPVPVSPEMKAKEIAEMSVSVKAYYGSSVVPSADCRYDVSVSHASLLSAVRAGGKVKISVKPNESWADVQKASVTVSVAHPRYGTRAAVITLYPIAPGADSMFHTLLLSHSALSFQRNADGKVIGSYTLSASVLSHKGDDLTESKEIPSGLFVYFGYDNAIGSKPLPATAPQITAGPQSIAYHKFIRFELWRGLRTDPGSKLLDKESVPIVVDGQKGPAGSPGKDGTSVNIKDTLNSVADLDKHRPGNPGDAYLINGEMYVWIPELKDYKNMGNIEGPAGQPAYIHIAYAEFGKDGLPVKFSIDDPTGCGWIGTYTDNNPGQDDEHWQRYDWMHVEGMEGLTISVMNEKLVWKKERDEAAVIFIDLYSGTKVIPYSDGSNDGFSVSTLPDIEGFSWSFYYNYQGHASAYVVRKSASVVLNVEIPFTITYRGVVYSRMISIRTNEDGERGAEFEIVPWASGRKFYSGAPGEAVYSLVTYIPKNQKKKKIFRCKRTHVSSDENCPVDGPKGSSYWSDNNFDFVATDLALVRKILAEEIDVENMSVRQLETKNVSNGPRVLIKEGLMEVYAPEQLFPNIRFGVNAQGMSVLEYYDNSGRKLYDLGPDGIKKISGAQMVGIFLCYICDSATPPTAASVQTIMNPSKTKYYRYQAGDLHDQGNGRIHTGNHLTGQIATDPLATDGWYTNEFDTPEVVTLATNPTAQSSDAILIGNFTPHRDYYRRKMFRIFNGYIQKAPLIEVYWGIGSGNQV